MDHHHLMKCSLYLFYFGKLLQTNALSFWHHPPAEKSTTICSVFVLSDVWQLISCKLSYYDRKLLLVLVSCSFQNLQWETFACLCFVCVRRCCWYVVCTAVWVDECQFLFSLVFSQLQCGVITYSCFSSPCVGKQAVHDPPFVLRGDHHSLLHVVVLLLRVACTTHHPGLHEGGPRVLQQGFNAPFIHLKEA